MSLRGRAVTDEQKRAVLQDILQVWIEQPQLRLGQLLVSATEHAKPEARDLSYVQDGELVELVQATRTGVPF